MTCTYHGEIEISPAFKEADAAILTAVLNGQTTEAAAVFPYMEAAVPKVEAPYRTGLLTVSEDTSTLIPEEDNSRHGLADWLRLARQRAGLSPLHFHYRRQATKHRDERNPHDDQNA